MSGVWGSVRRSVNVGSIVCPPLFILRVTTVAPFYTTSVRLCHSRYTSSEQGLRVLLASFCSRTVQTVSSFLLRLWNMLVSYFSTIVTFSMLIFFSFLVIKKFIVPFWHNFEKTAFSIKHSFHLLFKVFPYFWLFHTYIQWNIIISTPFPAFSSTPYLLQYSPFQFDFFFFFNNPLTPYSAVHMYVAWAILWSMENLQVTTSSIKSNSPSPATAHCFSGWCGTWRASILSVLES